MFPPDSVISGYVSRDFIDICFMFYLSLLPYVSLACTMSSLSLSRTPQFPLDPILLSSLRLLRSRTCIPLRCIRSLVYIFRVLVVRIRSTILTQPGTPVSFRGMLFTHYSISGNSGLRRFPRFSYYVISLVSCLHLSLVTPSAVGNTSLSPDPQFPFALSYCSCLCNSVPIPCTWYNSNPFLSYKYLYSVARIIRMKITIFHPSRLTRPLLPLSTRYSFPDPEIPESRNSHALSNSEIRDP